MQPGRILTIGLFAALLTACDERSSDTSAQELPSPKNPRPNILLIVADDLGYSDLGSFGGDAQTPNLDRLATEGIRLTNFYAAPSCSPSRAQLLSGADNHLVGLGNMSELLFMYPWQQGKPGYEGYLNQRALTIATVLKEHGYHTYMTGKWHMGHEPDQIPHARGFERSYALMQGTSSHNAADNGREGHPTTIMENAEQVTWPKDKYSTTHYTDKLLEFLDADVETDQPFFAYLAYTAPHIPLHAPRAIIEQYRGQFDAGYETLKSRRLERMHELGIIADKSPDVSSHPRLIPWESLEPEQQQIQSRIMEVYTAMIDAMDQNVGRIIDYLDQAGKLDNTLVIFLSDNGAADTELATFPIWKDKYESSDNSLENIGRADSWVGLGVGWAHAVTVPDRLAKHFTSDGGIHVPAFVWLPGVKSNGRISKAFTQIRDIAPTLIEYAGIELSATHFQQRNVQPWTGRSLKALLSGQSNQVHAIDQAFGWEHRERFALIKGDWKLLKLPEPYGTGNWELINRTTDPGETTDLSRKNPSKFAELLADWEAYVRTNNVLVQNTH